MKNNFKALGLHLMMVILSTIFLIIFVITGPIIGQYVTHIISRVIMGIGFIVAYIYLGTFLNTDTNRKYDFLTGCFIALVGIALWFYTFSTTGKDLFIIPREESEYWILMNVYHTPFMFINFIWEVPNTPIVSFITNLFPTLLMGVGLKYKRLKITKDHNKQLLNDSETGA